MVKTKVITDYIQGTIEVTRENPVIYGWPSEQFCLKKSRVIFSSKIDINQNQILFHVISKQDGEEPLNCLLTMNTYKYLFATFDTLGIETIPVFMISSLVF